MRLGKIALSKRAQVQAVSQPDSLFGGVAGAAASLGQAGQGRMHFEQTNLAAPQGVRLQSSPAATDAGVAGAHLTTRDAARHVFVGALGPIGAMMMPMLAPMFNFLPDSNLSSGRLLDPTVVANAQSQTQALNDISVEELRNIFSTDVRRLMTRFGISESIAERVGDFIDSRPPSWIQPVAPYIAHLSSAFPGIFSQTTEAQDFARIARVMNGGQPPTDDDLRMARETFEQVWNPESGIYPESMIGGDDRHGALQSLVLALETQRGDRHMVDAQHLAQINSLADGMYQASGHRMPFSAVTNLMRSLGPDALADDPSVLASIGQRVGEAIGSGDLDPEMVHYAVQQYGLTGVRTLAIASRLQNSQYGEGESSSAALSHAVEFLHNSEPFRYADAVMRAGNDNQRKAVEEAIRAYNTADTDDRRAAAWDQLSGLRNNIHRLGGKTERQNIAHVFNRGIGSTNRQTGGPAAVNSVADRMSQEAFEDILFREGASAAGTFRAGTLQAALRGDEQALQAMREYKLNHRIDGVDRASLERLEHDPSMRAALLMRLHQQTESQTRERHRQRRDYRQQQQQPAQTTDPTSTAAQQPDFTPQQPQNASADTSSPKMPQYKPRPVV